MGHGGSIFGCGVFWRNLAYGDKRLFSTPNKMNGITFITSVDPWGTLAIAMGATSAGSALVLRIVTLCVDHSPIVEFVSSGECAVAMR